MKIAFVGDISLNDEYNNLYRIGVNPFKEIGVEIKENDYIIGNL